MGAVGGIWNPFGLQLMAVIAILELRWGWSLNGEGVALLEFRAMVDSDPHGVFDTWNRDDENPCLWTGVSCVATNVEKLNLSGFSLHGVLAPELGHLNHLKYLVLSNNHFIGAIPKELGVLNMLELLDLRYNKLNGSVPTEIKQMPSLRDLMLCGNEFQNGVSEEVHQVSLFFKAQFDKIVRIIEGGFGSQIRTFGYLFEFIKAFLQGEGNRGYCHIPSEFSNQAEVADPVLLVRRRFLGQSSNLRAREVASRGPPSSGQVMGIMINRSSGSFPAFVKGKRISTSFTPDNSADPHHNSGPRPDEGSTNSGNVLKYMLVVPGIAFLLLASVAAFVICHGRGVRPIVPWKTGLSGQLQKAFVTGVPKLNRSELEIACEDFSNIIDSHEDCTVFKGTLSSGVEIAVVSTSISSSKDWSKLYEISFRHKIETLSRVNHKNFVNLIGYCEEDYRLARMMVFEYAPNGTLFEHLHVKGAEHLDWNARIRIVMGTAYCLQYMHHDLNPPVSHPSLSSSSIYLTEDYAAKVGEMNLRTKASSENKGNREMSNPETNVYDFGIILLEIISGKLPFSEEQYGSILNLMGEKGDMSRMIDPTLKTIKKREVEVMREVIEGCVEAEREKRISMREVVLKLRDVINIPPDAATPKLSPLWWAELEILSVEAP